MQLYFSPYSPFRIHGGNVDFGMGTSTHPRSSSMEFHNECIVLMLLTCTFCDNEFSTKNDIKVHSIYFIAVLELKNKCEKDFKNNSKTLPIVAPVEYWFQVWWKSFLYGWW